MTTDPELLRRYLEDNDESAFAELVQRHLGLVYSVALRRVGGDAQLAEDVAQNVFADLARKAASLIERPALSGWLYGSAHVASAAIVRRERRRKTHETEAHLMQTILSASEPNADWTHLRPVIDDAIIALKEEEREAIALRFFEQRSFPEVGAALRVTEDAARKRVDRALDKLRTLLERRGVRSTAGALALTLAAISVSSVPVALAGKIAHHAVAQATATVGTSFISSVAATLAPAAAVLLVGGFLIGSQRGANNILRAEVDQLTRPASSVDRLQADIQQLTRGLAHVDELRRAEGEIPALRTTLLSTPARPRPNTAALTVTPQGTLSWGTDGVKLFEFIARLRALKSEDQSGESKLVIRAPGANFSALTYAIEEARKAGIQHVIVESDAKPDPKMGFSWF
jgi:RNA polymerase sigma factor (sigma-70 family)